MEGTYNTKAIILDRFSFKENDVRLVAWSEDKGKIELIAKGSKKLKSKIAGHIEPLTLSRLMVVRSRNDFDYVGVATGEVFFNNLKNDLDKLVCAGKVLRLVNNLSRAEEGDGAEVFSLLKSFLSTLDNREDVNSDLLYNFFVLKFLSQIGFLPNLISCTNCNKKALEKENPFFDFKRGGLICLKCKDKEKGSKNILPVSVDSIKVLKFSLNSDFNKLSNLKVNKRLEKEIKENIINSFLKYNFNF